MRLDELQQTYQFRCDRLGIKPTDACLLISLQDYTLSLLQDGIEVKVYPVALSQNPPSCVAGSEGTPCGLHTIAEKIGGDQPSGMVFRGRVPTGQHYSEISEGGTNLITSRILRLRGLEPGLNAGPGCDTYDRLVYIHGTNHEDRMGAPLTAGCPVMRNADVIDLFERVESGTHVFIG